MFPQWLRSLRPSRERKQPTRRPRSFVPRVESLEGRDVPSTTVIASGLEGAQGSAVGPGGALYVTEGVAGRLSRVDPDTGAVTTVATGLPTGPFAGFGGGAVDVAFLGEHPLRPGRRCRLRRRRRPTWSASTGWTARPASPSSPTSAPGRWSTRRRRTSSSRPGMQYRAGAVPRRVPGHRRAPQPRAGGRPRRRHHRGDRVRQRRPDRAGGAGQHGLRGPGRPRPAPARGRQDRVVPAEFARRHAGRRRRPAPHRRGVRPGQHPVRPLERRLGGRLRGRPGGPEHRRVPPGQRRRHVHRPRGRDRPADLARVHPRRPPTSSPSAGRC